MGFFNFKRKKTVAEEKVQVEEGLEKTVDWYLENSDWLNDVTSGAYQKFYEEQYKKR